MKTNPGILFLCACARRILFVAGLLLASGAALAQTADLALAKVVDNPTPNVGDTILFTVTLSNAGPDTATNVTVGDVLPPGLTFVSATPSQGTYSSGTGVWTVGTVTTVTSPTLQIHASVASPTPQANLAQILSSDQADPNAANNTGIAVEIPQQADLSLAKIVGSPTPNVGDTVTFAVTVTNAGPDAATNVAVQDLLPAGLTFVSAIPSQGSYNSVSGAWNVGTVANASSATLQIQATVVSPNPQTNTATVSHADQFDPNAANNSASATETPQQADLALAKIVSNATPPLGSTITFTLTLTDNGPDAATSVTVQDLLPAGLAFVSSTPSQGTYSSISGTWTVGTVNPGTPQTLQIQAVVASPNPQTNTASISHADQFDPNPGNNSASATETPPTDLALVKTVSNPTPNVGDLIMFTITLTDAGPAQATNVTVQDSLPAGLTFVSAAPSQGTYVSGSGVWTVGTITTATPLTLQIQAAVASPNPQTNVATISHADQADTNVANNTASATETPQQADLRITKGVSNPTPNVGDTISFTVNLTDLGPNNATNVTVQDTLPAGLTFVSATPSQGTYSPVTGAWTVGTVTTATAQTLVIQATVVSPNPQTNTASISHSDQFDLNTANNTGSATETPQQADLALAKIVSNPSPNVGTTITFTVTLTDVGPSTATNVTVQDALPAGLTLVSFTPSQGTYNPGTGVWTVGTVTPGTPQTLQIQATVASTVPQTNTATISHSDQFDPSTANNSASVTETPPADLGLTKIVSNATPNVGDTITFTVTLTDIGPATATNVTVQDSLPAGLTFVSATPSQGTYAPGTGVWTVGTMTTATPQTLTITATVASPTPQTNTATISHSDQPDTNAANNTASATETPQQADLRVTKIVNNPAPNVGDTITYTVTLTDLGPSTATNVTVQDPLPTGLALVSTTPSQGTYNSGTGVWTVGTVTTATSPTLLVQATVVSANPGANTAAVSHSDQFDPNTANNSASVTLGASADLALAETVSNATPNVGDTITFTVTLTDLGPSTATNVTVTDLLPAGLTFVSAAASQGTYASGTGVWTVGTVTTGSPRTLAIQATVASPNAQTNTAAVSHSDQPDPTTANNTASATATPQQADLVLTKTASTATPAIGQSFSWTVTVSNSGPSAATNVTATDVLPAGVTFVSSTPSQGTYNSGTGLWTIGTLANGASATLVITVTSSAPAAVTNSASVTHSDQFDPNGGNSAAASPVAIGNPVVPAVPSLTPLMLLVLGLMLLGLGAMRLRP